MSACRDAEGGPLALAVAQDTRGAVLLSENLDVVPALLSQQGLEEKGALEAESWWYSWEIEPREGEELRSRIRPAAARHLSPALGPEGVRDLVGSNGLKLYAAETLVSFMEAGSMRAAMESARSSQDAASSALEAGEWEDALISALETGDALWQVSPGQVAKDLIREAETALGRNPGSRTYSQEELIRIRRLMYGANEALDAGDYPGAIRRAYYACQLLGANPP